MPLATSIKVYLAICLSARCVSGLQAQHAEPPQAPVPTRTVFIVQSYYHTGIIFELDAETRRKLDFAKQFAAYRYVDIGWGEEVFYQDPEFTLIKAARAILCPSNSVIRVEGFNQEISDVVVASDRAMKFSVPADQFARLCAFINGSLKKNERGGLIVESSRENGAVIFFKSTHTYCLFNTCNTWIAEALRYAGLNVSPACVVTASTLFHRLKNKGETLR